MSNISFSNSALKKLELGLFGKALNIFNKNCHQTAKLTWKSYMIFFRGHNTKLEGCPGTMCQALVALTFDLTIWKF